MKLAEKVALVTGASRGIGLSTAKILAENGAKVAMTAKDSDRLQNSSQRVPNSICISGDIKNSDDVKNIVKKAIDEFGRLDILINNAGIFPKIKQLHEIDDSEWQEVLDVNLTGQFKFTREAIPHLQKTGGFNNQYCIRCRPKSIFRFVTRMHIRQQKRL